MPNMICYNCGKEFTCAQGDPSPVCTHCSAVNYLNQEQAGSRMRRLLNASLSSWDLFEQETSRLDAGLAEDPADSALLWNRFLCDLRVRYIEDDKPVFYRRIEQPVTETAFFAPLWKNTYESERPALQQEISNLEAHRQAIEQEFARTTGGFILIADCGGAETNALCEKLTSCFSGAGLNYAVLNGDPAMDPQNFVALGNACFLILVCKDQKQLNDERVKSMYERFLLFNRQERSAVSVCVCTPSGDSLSLTPILAGASSLVGNRLDFNNRLWKQINDVLGTAYALPAEEHIFRNNETEKHRNAGASMQELLSRHADPAGPQGQTPAGEKDHAYSPNSPIIRKNTSAGTGIAMQSIPEFDSISGLGRTGTAHQPETYTPGEKKKKKTVLIAGIGAAVVALGVGAALTPGPAKNFIKGRQKASANAADYKQAQQMMTSGNYEDAIAAFDALGNYNDSASRAEEARNKQKAKEEKRRLENDYAAAEALLAGGEYGKAAAAFDALGNYSDAASKAAEAGNKQKAEEEKRRLENDYAAAETLLTGGEYEKAAAAFDALGDYKDAASKAEDAREALTAETEKRRLENDYAAAEALLTGGEYEEAAKAFDALGDYNGAASKAAEARNKLKAEEERLRLENDYAAAEALLTGGEYEKAAAAFDALGDYNGAASKAAEARDKLKAEEERLRLENDYAAAEALLNDGKYEEAAKAFNALNGYADASAKAEEARNALRSEEELRQLTAAYSDAETLLNAGRYEEAADAFDTLGEFSDAAAKAADARSALKAQQDEEAYRNAEALMSEGRYEEAAIAFGELGDFGDAAEKALNARDALERKRQEEENARIEREKKDAYDKAVAALNAGDPEGAIAIFDSLGDYSDAAAQIVTARELLANMTAYSKAEELLESGEYEAAAEAFANLGTYSDAMQKAEEANTKLIRSGMPYDGEYMPGSVITLGTFVQNGTEATPVEWIVLSSDEDTALLICRYAPAVMAWSAKDENAGWEDSDIRKWLNETFAQTAFDEKDALSMISDMSGDPVTLLTAAEAKTFFTDDESRVCEVTDAAQMQRGSARYSGSACGWWLKDKTPTRGKIFTVATGGAIPTAGSKATESPIAVRPVIRVDLHILNGENAAEED